MEAHEEAGPSMHPERPDRVRAVMARLHAAELDGRCRRLPAREASEAEITACHVPDLLAAVDYLSEQSRLAGGTGLQFTPGEGPRAAAGGWGLGTAAGGGCCCRGSAASLPACRRSARRPPPCLPLLNHPACLPRLLPPQTRT